jgi:sugar phosphate isomerase/epimerase
MTLGRLADAGAADAAFRLNFILGSPMYGTTPLAEVLGEVKKTGAEWIDIWPRRHADHREQVEAMGHARFLELLEEHGVRLGVITRYDLGPYGLQDEMHILKKLGGRLIVTGARGAEGDTLRDQVKAFVASLAPHVAVAEELGVTIGIENHSRTLINTPDSIRYFGEFAESPHLGIALAPYHLPQQEDTIARVIADLGPKLVFFQAKTPVTIYVVHHPQCSLAEKLASRLFKWFRLASPVGRSECSGTAGLFSPSTGGFHAASADSLSRAPA